MQHPSLLTTGCYSGCWTTPLLCSRPGIAATDRGENETARQSVGDSGARLRTPPFRPRLIASAGRGSGDEPAEVNLLPRARVLPPQNRPEETADRGVSPGVRLAWIVVQAPLLQQPSKAAA